MLKTSIFLSLLSILISGCSTNKTIAESHSPNTRNEIFIGKTSASLVFPDVHVMSLGGLVSNTKENFTETKQASKLFEYEIKRTIGKNIYIKSIINERCNYLKESINDEKTCSSPLVRELRKAIEEIATGHDRKFIHSALPSDTDLTIYTFSVDVKNSVDYGIAAILATAISGETSLVTGSARNPIYTKGKKEFYSLRKNDITGILIIDNKTKMILWHSIIGGYNHDITDRKSVEEIFNNNLTKFNY